MSRFFIIPLVAICCFCQAQQLAFLPVEMNKRLQKMTDKKEGKIYRSRSMTIYGGAVTVSGLGITIAGGLVRTKKVDPLPNERFSEYIKRLNRRDRNAKTLIAVGSITGGVGIILISIGWAKLKKSKSKNSESSINLLPTGICFKF